MRCILQAGRTHDEGFREFLQFKECAMMWLDADYDTNPNAEEANTSARKSSARVKQRHRWDEFDSAFVYKIERKKFLLPSSKEVLLFTMIFICSIPHVYSYRWNIGIISCCNFRWFIEIDASEPDYFLHFLSKIKSLLTILDAYYYKRILLLIICLCFPPTWWRNIFLKWRSDLYFIFLSLMSPIIFFISAVCVFHLLVR